MRGNKALRARLDTVAGLVDKIDRKVERIELVTVVREPNTSVAADAYEGLRKQVIAATGERNAHLHQLVQFDIALRNGATAEELGALVGEWIGQTSVVLVDDPSVEHAFEFVGPADGENKRVVNPAYVDALTGRVIKAGLAERTTEPADQVVPEAPALDPQAEEVEQ